MNTLLQTALIDSVYDEGQRIVPGTTFRAQDILTNEYVIPEPIHEFLTNIGTVITPGGQMVKTNVPDSIVPQPPDEDEEDQEIPSGTFGMPDDENHNAYEVNVCPYTTMGFVEVSALEEHKKIGYHYPSIYCQLLKITLGCIIVFNTK